jgi:hypothetical protein
MDGWRGMLLDDVPSWEGTPQIGLRFLLGSSFLGKQVYCSQYHVFTSNIMYIVCV